MAKRKENFKFYDNKEVMLKLIEFNDRYFYKVSLDLHLDVDVCIAALKSNINVISQFDENLKCNIDVAKACVSINPDFIHRLSNNLLRNRKKLYELVKLDWRVILKINKKYVDKNILDAAIKQNKFALLVAPKKYRKNDYFLRKLIQYFPQYDGMNGDLFEIFRNDMSVLREAASLDFYFLYEFKQLREMEFIKLHYIFNEKEAVSEIRNALSNFKRGRYFWDEIHHSLHSKSSYRYEVAKLNFYRLDEFVDCLHILWDEFGKSLDIHYHVSELSEECVIWFLKRDCRDMRYYLMEMSREKIPLNKNIVLSCPRFFKRKSYRNKYGSEVWYQDALNILHEYDLKKKLHNKPTSISIRKKI